jgi:type IV pilus assembly protein PilM
MAQRQFAVWGIDMGQCALKAMRLEVKDGQVVATAFEYIEHPKILSQPDADPDELTREALTQFLSRNNIKGDLVAISVPGQSGLARFVKLPPVDEKKIADIVKFEAKQQIPFPLEEVVWDFQRLNRGDIVDGMALETEIGLFAMKRDMVNRSLNQFKGVNIEVHVVQMAPLALCNFVAYDLLGKDTANVAEDTDEAHACIVCLEIGTDSSNLVITDGGRIIWQRPIPIGGNHFTRALTKEMKLTFAKAEHLKRNAAKSPELKKILSALKQVLNDFVGEVQRSLGYFTNTHRNAQIQYMIGLGNAFRLPGLQKFLQEKLQLEVRKLQQLERTTGESVTAAPTFSENIMSFGVAYGLALQGLKQARLQTNLLPYEVRLERMIRGKKPWVVAAAAALLIGMCTLAFAKGKEKSAVENDSILKGMEQLKNDAKKVADNERLFKEQQKKVEDKIKSLQKIGAGVNERMNWQLLHQYVNMSTPQPNGDHLVVTSKRLRTVKATYWNDAAKKAYKDLEDARFAKVALDPATARKKDAEIKMNLIQVNIAGINALYTEDLYAFFNKIRTESPLLRGMHAEHKARVEEFLLEKDAKKREAFSDSKTNSIVIPKEGWIVEVRGYTYQKDGVTFIEDTIIENLANTEALKDHAGKDLVGPEMAKQIKDHVRFLHIYKIQTIDNPVPGQFDVIGKSYLKVLQKGTPAVVEAKGGAQQPAPGAGPAAADVKTRDGWNPIGEVAKDLFVDNPGGALGARPDANAAVVAQPIPRTEFVVVFVWAEPIAALQTINLTDKK